MVGTWTYDPTNNVLTVVGGSSGSPVGFADAWNADKAGTRILKAAAASPFTASLDTAVKPTDSLALKLSAVITNFSAAGTVTLTGKDAWGNSISEVLNVTANGTVVSTQYYASIDANGVVAAGTFTAAITQPRWGVVWQQAQNSAAYLSTFDQYILLCHLHVGDGSTASYFADLRKQVTFLGNFGIRVKNNAAFRIGEVYSSANKVGRYGCDLFFRPDSGYDYGYWLYGEATSTIELYASSMMSKWQYGYLYHDGSSGVRLKMWQFRTSASCIAWNGPVVDAFQVDFVDGRTILWRCAGTADKITVVGRGFTDAMPLGCDSNKGISLKNVYIRSTGTTLFRAWGITVDVHLINVDSDVWTFQWDGVNTARVYRQYEFDLSAEPGATVTLKDNAGSTVFSVTADVVTGVIATQTVSYGYYDQAHGNIMQSFSPFTLTITKAGKMPHTQTGIVLSEKTKLLIALRDQLTGTATAANVAVGATFYKDDADSKLVGSHANPAILLDVASGKPVLNLNNKKLDNQLVLGL